MAAIVAATLASVFIACGESREEASPGVVLVTAPQGASYAYALIGPMTLDIETVGGATRCFMVARSDGTVHGVVWPFGTTANGNALSVPGLTDPLVSGATFWAGGGIGDNQPSLGACNKSPVYYLGPTAFPTDPRGAPGPASS